MPSNRSSETGQPDALRLTLLGAPRLAIGDAPVTVDTRKALAIAAYLALDGGSVSRATLAALLWPEYDDEHARGALRRTLSVLRTALGGLWVSAAGDLVQLDLRDVEIDLLQARQLVEATRRHAHREFGSCPRCRSRLADAAALYRGDFMAGFALRDSPEWDDWQALRAAETRGELAAVLEDLTEAELAADELAAALGHALRWVSLDPLHEAAHRAVMRVHAARGDRAAALAQYRACVRVLDEELGVAPLEETSALQSVIAEGRLATSPARAGSPALGETRPIANGFSHRIPLVGRASEIAALASAVTTTGDRGRVLLIVGEAGIGKSRLLHELERLNEQARRSVIAVRCREGEGALAFGPLGQAIDAAVDLRGPSVIAGLPPGEIAALAGLSAGVGRLSRDNRPFGSESGGRLRLFSAAAALLTGALRAGGMLIVDDAQWADADSADFIGYLISRLDQWPIGVALGLRPEPTGIAALLQHVTAEAERRGEATVIRPGRLERQQIAQMVRASDASLAARSATIEPLAARLEDETDGIPLLVVEYLEALSRGELQADGANDRWPLPGGLRDLLAARIALLSESTRQVLDALAIAGVALDADLAREVSGRSEPETLAALDQLVTRGVLRPVRAREFAGGYEFSHEHLRRLADELVGPSRRRLLHGRAADALLRRAGRSTPSGPGVIAMHLQLAGRPEEAAEIHRRAGLHARRLYANREALDHLRAALALGDGDVSGIHEAIGDLETLGGAYSAALSSYEAAAANAADVGSAAVEEKLGALHQRRGANALAELHLSAALEALPGQDAGARARVLAARALTRERLGRSDEALDDADAAVRLAETSDEPDAISRAHNARGMLASGRGDAATARRQFELSLAAAGGVRDPAARIAALNNLARHHSAVGEAEIALELTDEALRLCTALGDRHREAALRSNRADLLHAADRRQEAREELARSATLFADVGEPGILQPEIWKLVEW